ncbi:hypothetical protein L7F22_045299 [Adiantum nelumboides]|nr:hypothetical protein [Adiantum nelumboides]
MKKLLQHTLTDGADVKTFLQSWRVLLDNVLLFGVALGANQQGLLMSLPPSWRSFISTQLATAALSMTDLYARILQEDSLRNSSATSPTELSLSTVASNFTNYRGQFNGRRVANPSQQSFNRRQAGPSRPTGRFPPYNPKSFCRSCNRRGHYDRDWRTRRRSQGMRHGHAQSNHAAFEHNQDVCTYPAAIFQAFAAMDTSRFRADRDVWYLDTVFCAGVYNSTKPATCASLAHAPIYLETCANQPSEPPLPTHTPFGTPANSDTSSQLTLKDQRELPCSAPAVLGQHGPAQPPPQVTNLLLLRRLVDDRAWASTCTLHDPY